MVSPRPFPCAHSPRFLLLKRAFYPGIQWVGHELLIVSCLCIFLAADLLLFGRRIAALPARLIVTCTDYVMITGLLAREPDVCCAVQK